MTVFLFLFQVNRQYTCNPSLNTLNVLLGTLNQVFTSGYEWSMMESQSSVACVSKRSSWVPCLLGSDRDGAQGTPGYAGFVESVYVCICVYVCRKCIYQKTNHIYMYGGGGDDDDDDHPSHLSFLYSNCFIHSFVCSLTHYIVN